MKVFLGNSSDEDFELEQPLFTTKAHVFQIDPETKKNWIPVSKSAVSVSYYYDTTRDTYRIISVDGSKAIVNSTITPTMTFTKTSQKFGQWSDARANTVYGLGFTSESELSKFIEKFKEIKELTRNSVQQKNTEVNGTTDNHLPPQPQSPSRQVFHQRTSSWSSSQSDSSSLRERRNSYTQGSTSPSLPTNTTEGQLKYENDRLKLALAQSSSNAKKWEVELQTLKNNNARLTAALQESTANVEEWKKQLATYKDEAVRMKKKVLELESKHMTSDHSEELKQKIKQLTDQMDMLHTENTKKQEEVMKLKKEVSDLNIKESSCTSLQVRIQALEEENHSLASKVQDLQRILQDCRKSREAENRDILNLQDTLGTKITELYELHEQIVSTVKKESQS